MTDDKCTDETMVNNIEIIVNGVNQMAKNVDGKGQQESNSAKAVGMSRSAFICLLNAQQKLRLYSSLAMSAALIPLIVHRVWHRIGTKRFILLANAFVIVSWILIIWSDTYWILIVSRCFGGIAVGILHVLVPLYINDVISVDQKALCHSIMHFQFVLGVLVQHILRIPDSFLIIHLVPIAVSLIQFITTLSMPESIRYLALQTKMSDIQQIRANLRCDHNNIENDLAIWTEHKNQFRAAFKGNITYVVPVFGLYICKQMTGVVPVLFYFQTIFELIDGEFAPVTMTISCVGVFAVSTLASHYRTTSAASIKSSLLFSTKLMAIILVVLGTYCHLHGSLAVHYSDGYRHIPFVCLVLLYVTFAFGPFRLTSEYVDHIIPAQIYFNVRCLLTAVNWLLIYVMISVLPGLISNIGVGWLFWFMALMCMFMAFFVRRCMPTVTAPKPSQFV